MLIYYSYCRKVLLSFINYKTLSWLVFVFGILSLFTSYILLYFQNLNKTPILFSNFEKGNYNANVSDQNNTKNVSRMFIASKTGKTYGFPWCSGQERIKESNVLIFMNEKEAQKAGYLPSKNCKGLNNSTKYSK